MVYNADDKAIIDILKAYKGEKIGYGVGKNNKKEVRAENIKVKNNRQIFDVYYKNKKTG